MNCPKCNAELRPGAKFCTKCGQKLDVSAACPQCGASLKTGAKFCTKCGHRLVSQEIPAELPTEKASVTQIPQDMNTAKGRIYWNVQPGQVARVINESEFESYNKIQGVIIPEGMTAYIRANGRTIASISGGCYDFVENVQAPPANGLLSKAWHFITGLFSSQRKSKNNNVASDEELLYQRQQNLILENAKRGAAFSVVILLDKAFPLMIGSKHENLDEYKSFQPMIIQTRNLEVGLGVNAYFKIADPETFIIHYLTERQLLSSALIAHELTDSIRVALQDALYNVELESNRIPAELHNLIKDRINAVVAEASFGLSVVRIVEVSAESKDLERFVKLSQELYLSEKELDYLRRTNDFKNRLADVVNAQEIHQANTELELKRQLNVINRNSRNEELLNEDELRKFEHLLANERIVREARSDGERDEALAEILKTGLIREEELKVLQHQLKVNDHQRVVSLAMMQLRDNIEFERVRLEGEADKASLIVKKELELQGLRDEYTDSRFYQELEKQRTLENTKLDLEQRKRDMDYNDVKRLHDLKREDDDAQFQQFLAMQDSEERSKENQRKHEAEMERERLRSIEEQKRMEWEGAQNLSEEKIWALKGGDEAVAYAQSKYNADAERRANEMVKEEQRRQEARLDAERASRDAENRNNTERMFEMMNNMMAMAGGMQMQRAEENDRRMQEKLADKDRQIREREDRIRRQEGRMDTAYDRALDYTTRSNVVPQQSQQPSQQQIPSVTQQTPPVVSKSVQNSICLECGENVDSDSAFCENCGTPVNS